MAKYIRAVQLPNGDLITIDTLGAVKGYDSGVGLLDPRNRMIGWVEIAQQEGSDQQVAKVLDIFNDLINNRRRSEQPDWSFLTEKPLSEQPRAKSKTSSIVVAS